MTFKTSQKKRARNRRWRHRNPETARACSRADYARNQGKRLEKARIWRTANPGVVQEQNRRFREANPNYFREYAHRRRLRYAWRKWSATCAENRCATEIRD